MSYFIIIIINAFREKCVKAFYPLSLITHIKQIFQTDLRTFFY